MNECLTTAEHSLMKTQQHHQTTEIKHLVLLQS